MSKRTLALIIFLTVLTGFFIYLAVSQNRPQPTPSPTVLTPTKKPVPAYTTLTLSPQTLTLSSNSGSLAVMIDTGSGEKTNAVTAVQLEMEYDPKVLTAVTLTSGSFIPNATPLVNNIDQTNGKITYALAIPPSGSGVSGKGSVATIQFRSLIPQGSSTTVRLLPTTLVTAQGVSESVLLKATGATITVGTAVTPAPTAIQQSPQTAPAR